MPLYVAATADLLREAYYATRPFDETSLEARSAPGPYKVGKFEINRYVEFDRVKD